MEGGNSDNSKKPVSFRSENLNQTKAYEKREVFVNVQEKKTAKTLVNDFQKKFAYAKSHTEETKAKIQNPNGEAQQKKPFPTKKVLKISIPIAILLVIGIVVYMNWRTIYSNYFEISKEKALTLLKSGDKSGFEEHFTKLTSKAKDDKEKSFLYVWKAGILDAYCGSDCSAEILETAHESEEIIPSKDSALVIYQFETKYGDETEAQKWLEKSMDRESIGEEVG